MRARLKVLDWAKTENQRQKVLPEDMEIIRQTIVSGQPSETDSETTGELMQVWAESNSGNRETLYQQLAAKWDSCQGNTLDAG